jgi:hypothetical protein
MLEATEHQGDGGENNERPRHDPVESCMVVRGAVAGSVPAVLLAVHLLDLPRPEDEEDRGAQGSIVTEGLGMWKPVDGQAVRGKVGIEQLKGGREQLIITEIPYGVNRALLVERIAELVNEKTIPDITAIRDESDENTRVVDRIETGRHPEGGDQHLYKFDAIGDEFQREHVGDCHRFRVQCSCIREHQVIRRGRPQSSGVRGGLRKRVP